MLKFVDIPAIGKQYNDKFHAFQISKIKYGQIQDKTNGAIWSFELNMVLNTKIIILAAIVQKLWHKTH